MAFGPLAQTERPSLALHRQEQAEAERLLQKEGGVAYPRVGDRLRLPLGHRFTKAFRVNSGRARPFSALAQHPRGDAARRGSQQNPPRQSPLLAGPL